MPSPEAQTFLRIAAHIKKPTFFVPRPYQTIGGMWTVDTWELDGVRVQVMDEGYTTILHAPGLRVVRGYNGKDYVRFEEGCAEDLERLSQRLSLTPQPPSNQTSVGCNPSEIIESLKRNQRPGL
jgi:hypothetical protein